MIEVRNLKKDYTIFKRKHIFSKRTVEIVHAVKGLDFSISDGEKVGLIGLNGAGKTTTIKMLTGILTPTEGEIFVNGFLPSERKREFLSQIGVSMGQRSSLFYDVALKESFQYYKEVYRVSDAAYRERMDEFDQIVGIKALMDTPVRKLSFGQRMKSELVCAMLHLPQVIFLDEPTIGLDVMVKENIFAFLTMLNQKYQTTILLTTHELESIEKFCQRILILKEGSIIYDGKISDFAGMDSYRKICIPKKLYDSHHFSFDNTVETENGIEFILNTKNDDYSSLFQDLIFSDFTVQKLSLADLIKNLEA